MAQKNPVSSGNAHSDCLNNPGGISRVTRFRSFHTSPDFILIKRVTQKQNNPTNQGLENIPVYAQGMPMEET